MSSPISIVIPVYNRADTLMRTLHSVERQSVRPARVILVDNGSTDGSMEMMTCWAEDKDYVKILYEPKRGACRARNRGLAEVESDFVSFFDSDDVMLPDHIRDFTKAIKENPDVDIFGRDIRLIFLSGGERRCYFNARSAMFNHLFRSSMSTQRVIVRTDLVRSVGGWNESLTGWDDYELGVRLLLASDRVMKLSGVPSVVAYQQEESLSGVDYCSHPERWEDALDTIRNVCRNTGRDDLQKWVDARAMILAAQYSRESAGIIDINLAARATSLSQRLVERTLSNTGHPLRMRLIYIHNKVFGRLTWVLARMLFLFG